MKNKMTKIRAVAVFSLCLAVGFALVINYADRAVQSRVSDLITELKQIAPGRTSRQEILAFAAAHPQIGFGSADCSASSCFYQFTVDNSIMSKFKVMVPSRFLVQVKTDSRSVTGIYARVTREGYPDLILKESSCPCDKDQFKFQAYKTGNSMNIQLTPFSNQAERDFAHSINLQLFTQPVWQKEDRALLTSSYAPTSRE